ncbi:MFS transporter [Patulibacter defluvii]|uniref:MFS transporter n=1 Tax=Patulibacter defluvii TaxID=3095358 RepID=UPI002A74D014|nr:MFS transporter [Patulibacter sp. DM4]
MRLFAIRDYRYLFSAQIIALFGTGLATVALGLLAYRLAGPDAGAVLGTALTIKMVMYVVIAPLAAAVVDRLPRRAFLATLDVVRAGVVLALPFVTEVWQIYVLIAVLQSASAAFTPTFQAVIPDIVNDEADYTRALSASQVAYTMESLLSPVLAAVALTLISFNWLFVGTSIGFAASALLVLSTRIPNARRRVDTSAWERVASGIRTFVATPRLRGVMALNLVVAAAGAIVVVNTVNYVRDALGGSQADVAWMLAASGGGTLLVALALPRVLDRVADRSVMLTGAAVLVAGVGGAVALAAGDVGAWAGPVAVWVLIGGGMALIVTPTGRVLRRSVEPDALPQVFAAQFSLSHLAWLVTYPIAGWIGTSAGFTVTWSILAGLAVAGTVAAAALWRRAPAAPRGDRPLRRAAEPAAGTLAAGQCSCVRPV